ncbi:MAG: hydroxymethylglutaryl-CoA lyase [Nitrospinota bacterium]|jgi:hydroxymethylglutaryl-CoA lyase|nr:hydroxymethylglutaryl-CoA lyase [Nitrospinota bacterium]MDP7167489.1 hydroxymethylglutaryl-CoA lyase [Nitrospinota bacterium]MDP7369072.1 hydroxymethylglutaryl-CoA lyase [Nitrospinota bacterium]MDP7502697.1 hydroxymethylglutaryl-CoA lyase [Nitrospinota bacterium]MDP7663311.1 hydroxymethylglutaryl-CoA lyase [Nitrospinota bacterium]
MNMPSQVHIVEVGTRDGIQAEKQFVELDQKLRMLELIVAAGVRRIEATSFVSPRHVPQMADAAEVLAGMERPPGVEIEALVPNMRGMERALECQLDRVVLFVAASEGFNLKNLRAGREKMLDAAREAAKEAHGAGMKIRGGVVTAFGCPYEGRVPLEAVERIAGDYADMGCDEVGLADTVGMTNPVAVRRMAEHIRAKFPEIRFTLHFHNTRGVGLANVLAGLEAGVDTFDTSIGGLGGCPFAPRATGNISTEDTVNMLHEMGAETGINLGKLLEAVSYAESVFGRQLPGQLLHAGLPEWGAPAA